jgi:hypothetical protein
MTTTRQNSEFIGRPPEKFVGKVYRRIAMHAVGTMGPALPALVLVIYGITPRAGNNIAALLNLQSAARALSRLFLEPEHNLSFFRRVETTNASLCFKQISIFQESQSSLERLAINPEFRFVRNDECVGGCHLQQYGGVPIGPGNRLQSTY